MKASSSIFIGNFEHILHNFELIDLVFLFLTLNSYFPIL